ncbi:AAA family ATPase [Rossellomorea marisflavi]|uniref:AAA family ATPase n=1 Tax=Rossellomorea marisflavi TaxID=189381 RepID=A0A165J3K2_9BACI|nr:AAA family ATPase [Rossellomorea marisflavi]KZE45184.1 AAA family ATPase [Rossellomorea marisflavi]USK94265.1 AAA family ATPase [Rossellomorea marisflavi]
MHTFSYLRSIMLKREEVPSFDRYPFNIPSIRTLDEINLDRDVTFIVGENGMGKSTLLESIAAAMGFNPEGGSLHLQFSTFDSHSDLDQYLRIIRGPKKPTDGYFLRAESFYNVATQISKLDEDPFGAPIIDSYGGKSLHEQSHGEAFFSTFMNRFRGHGVYILDEPEAALSPLRQMSMLTRIHELVNQKSQFIIATHSPILMAYPSSTIIELGEDGVRERKLEEVGHYRIMQQFFNDHKRMIHHLLKDD